MTRKTRSDFANHGDWLAYVAEIVPVTERSYAQACGRTELLKSFYAVRNELFPSEFSAEFERIRVLSDPERNDALDALNQRILSNLTGVLHVETQSKVLPVVVEISDDDVQRLLIHLLEKNPYFELWAAYKSAFDGRVDPRAWKDYLVGEIGEENRDDIAFAQAMVELDRLLSYFRSHKLPLPQHFFDRCWFLHYLRGPERMLQTRALLNLLAAEIEPCASA